MVELAVCWHLPISSPTDGNFDVRRHRLPSIPSESSPPRVRRRSRPHHGSRRRASRLAEWRDPDAIRSLARLAVCSREGRPDARGAGNFADGFQAERFSVPELAISSTVVRTRAAAGLPLTGWVPASVADYIVASQLYVE